MRDLSFPCHFNLAFYSPVSCQSVIVGDQPISPMDVAAWYCSIYVRCQESVEAVTRAHSEMIYPEDFNRTHVPLIEAKLQALADRTYSQVRSEQIIQTHEYGTNLTTESLRDAIRLMEQAHEQDYRDHMLDSLHYQHQAGPAPPRTGSARLDRAMQGVIDGTATFDELIAAARADQVSALRRSTIPIARTATEVFFNDFMGYPMPRQQGMSISEAEHAYQYFFRELTRRMTPEYFNNEPPGRMYEKMKRVFSPEGARAMEPRIHSMGDAPFRQLMDSFQAVGVSAGTAGRSMDFFSRMVEVEHFSATFRRNLLRRTAGENESDWWLAVCRGAVGMYSKQDLAWKERLEYTLQMENRKNRMKLEKMNTVLRNRYKLPPLITRKESTIVKGKSEEVAGYLHMNAQFKNFIFDLVNPNTWTPDGKSNEKRPKAKFHKFLNPM